MTDVFERIRRASDEGQAVAAAYTAVLAGLGQGEPQSWTTALERLARAAGLGSVSAQGQLQVLAGAAAGSARDWDALAAAVDLGPWQARASQRPLAPAARVAAVADFLPPAVCAWIIARAQGRTAPAQMYDRDGAIIQSRGRSNSAFEFGAGELDLVVVLARAKIAAAVGVTPHALETLQVLHYAPGQAFDQHYDYLDPATPGIAEEIAVAGQRIATFLTYLNDGYEGGETSFPLLGLDYKGRTGDALVFANITNTGEMDRRMLHAGRPPTSGEKWLLSQWIRDR
jgi:hypothetical protein